MHLARHASTAMPENFQPMLRRRGLPAVMTALLGATPLSTNLHPALHVRMGSYHQQIEYNGE